MSALYSIPLNSDIASEKSICTPSNYLALPARRILAIILVLSMAGMVILYGKMIYRLKKRNNEIAPGVSQNNITSVASLNIAKTTVFVLGMGLLIV